MWPAGRTQHARALEAWRAWCGQGRAGRSAPAGVVPSAERSGKAWTAAPVGRVAARRNDGALTPMNSRICRHLQRRIVPFEELARPLLKVRLVCVAYE